MNYNPETEVPTLIVSVDEDIIKETYYGENTPPIASDSVDCSTCTDYYPDAALSSPKDEYGTLTELTRHACAYYDNDTSNCCRYDKTTSLCGVYMDSMFLYPCGPSCSKAPPVTSDDDSVDCSTCTDYYRDAGRFSPRSEYGTPIELTRHACAYYDNDPSDCCRYDEEAGMCNVYADSMFQNPCGPSCNKKVNPLTIVLPLLGISALFTLFLVLRRRKNRIPKIPHSGKKDDPASDTTPFPIGVERGGTNPNIVPVPIVIGEIVQNDSGNYLPTVKAYPEPVSAE